MSTSETRVMTAHIPLPLAEQVDQLAARLERSRGWIVKQALSSFVEQEEHRYRLTLEGLSDVDFCRTIEHASVEAWVDSLETEAPLSAPSCK